MNIAANMVDTKTAEYEEEKNVEFSQAYNILAELEQEGLITNEKAELYKSKFFTLHEACVNEMKNEHKLSEKVSQYKKVRRHRLPCLANHISTSATIK